MTDSSRLDDLIADLRRGAAELQGAEDADRAAELVERCAELAGEVGAEVERLARASRAEPAPGVGDGQERLL